MTNVVHGLTREQMAQKVYGEEPAPKQPKKRKKKYNANEAMRMWIEATNKHFGGE